ncbi:hypothetical protein HPB50_021226 [Hyalomma asiaticum]|uniref:Uncharacterized protein n=1 Tax=Hyalomma asiaticum TaxID=266040 RepID=A0ACB7S0M8_HYAAI|nr:hypothetical protein HPB50_021226 [Hyalomma asiaticum]
MDFLGSDAAAKDSGDDSPNAQKKPFVSESVNALSEDLAQFATGSALTDAARSAAASAASASHGGGDAVSFVKDNHDPLDLLSDFQPNANASSPSAPAPDSSTHDIVGDLLRDASPPAGGAPLLKPSAPPAPDKVAPPPAAEPDLAPRPEPKNPPPPKQTEEPKLSPVADVKPTPVTSSTKPKESEMQREATSTTSFSKDRPSCCIFSPGEWLMLRTPITHTFHVVAVEAPPRLRNVYPFLSAL